MLPCSSGLRCSMRFELLANFGALRGRVLDSQEAEDRAASQRGAALIADAGISRRRRVPAAIQSRDDVAADMLHRAIGIRKDACAADPTDFETHPVIRRILNWRELRAVLSLRISRGAL